MTDVVVAGGGLAGLVAARHLAESGRDVTVFEQRSDVGGRIRTTHEDGYTFDRGFQVMFTAYPAAKRELDIEELSPRTFTPGATIASPNHRSVLSDPLRNPSAAPQTLLNTDVRTADKLRLFRLQRELAGIEPVELLSRGGRTIREYLADYGFSQKFVERFAAPFYGGITLDRSLGTDSSIFAYTYKMLSEGEIFVPADGMQAMPRQLADRARSAGATIETDAAVTDLQIHDSEVTAEVGSETVTAESAVVATDPRTAAELTDIDAIPTEPVGCVTQYFALPTNRAPTTGKRIILNAADDRPNTVAPLSAVASEYAPAGMELYSATFLGTPEEDDADLAAEVRNALQSWYPNASFDALELLRTDRVPFSQFAQPPGYPDALPDPTAPDGNAVLAGDYTRWSSIQGALESGKVAADLLQ
ncbi:MULTISPECIES: NAD(P)/FAD-dependent oxidoreductase [unclassified Haloarcula]|uniref:NAD(P)/FAD-dependent oxidoreductase n=1 Tax=unclassified Haloarcula TaxID=2624677 RepID=UPI00177F6280|nr:MULTISPECIES: NAD(P)/FAD-dependent oxidoreductase [unclassified Haloarcula]